MFLGKSLRFIWQKHEDIIAFISGDLIAIIFALQIDILHSVLKITGVFFFAVIGGMGGIVGKWLIVWLEKVFKKIKKRYFDYFGGL